jgi:hypothetical protein
LPQNSSRFAVLPPHFEDTRDSFVLDSTKQMFPVMNDDAHFAPVLQLCLASIVTHADFLREHLSKKHPLLSSYIFRCPDVLSRLEGLLATGNSWMRPTGIPPHVELFQEHVETRAALRQLPDLLLEGFDKLLQERSVGRESITRDTLGSTIRSLLEEAGLWQSQTNAQQAPQPDQPCNMAYHWPSDGRFRF